MRIADWAAVGLVFGTLAGAEPPLPPLIEEGEPIEEDVDTLLTAASGATFEGAIAFNHDGTMLTSASSDHTVRLWDVASGKEIRSFSGHRGLVLATAFSPDDRTLASASRDGDVRLWDVEGDQEPRILEGHSDFVNSVAFSPDGETLASASDDGTVRLWDVVSGQERQTLRGHEGRVTSVDFSPGGTILASASHDKSVRLWDVASGQELRPLIGHSDSVLSVAISNNDRIVASSSLDTTVRLWDVRSGQDIRVLRGHTQGVHSAAFSPDGTTLASSSDDNTIRLWDVESGDDLKILRGHKDTVNAVIFSPEGKMLASDSYDSTVRLWDVASGRVIKSLPGHFDWILSVAFSPDGKTLASGSVDKSVSIWGLESGRMLHKLKGHKDEVRSVAFSPDGKLLASASHDHTVRLWRVADGQEILPVLQHRDEVRALAFSPDGELLATGSSDNVVRLWKESNDPVVLTGHTARINAVAFSPDGRLLASASKDQNVRIWKVADHEWLAPALGHGDEVRSVAFSPSGESLVSGSSDSTVKIWTVGPWGVERGRNFRVLSDKERTVISSLSFSPDGKILACGSLDAAVHLWDVATGKEIHTLQEHRLGVQSVAFSPNGEMLASASTQVRVTSLGQGLRTSRIFAVGAEDSWIGCRIDSRVCFRHEVGNLLGKVARNGRFEPIPPNVDPGQAGLELVEAPTALTAVYGDTTDFRLKIRNTGSRRAFWVRARRRGGPSLSHPLSVSFPSPLGFLEPGETAELKGWVSTHSTNPRPQSTTLFLEVTTAIGAPVTVPSIEVTSKVPWSRSWPLVLALASAAMLTGALFLSLTQHPLVRRLSRNPQALHRQSPAGLSLARNLLRLTGRLGTVLAGAGVDRVWLDHAIAFVADPDPHSRCRRFAERLGIGGNAPEELSDELSRLKLDTGFPLNLDRLLLHFPPSGRPADDVVNRLRAKGETRDLITVIIAAEAAQQDALHRLVTADRGSLLVAPSGAELTELLLSATPTDVLARVIASQVRLTRISPYQTGGGVHRKALFFGRDGFLAHVLNREAANYLVVGGRQVGKSSLLKAIDRHYQDDSSVRCHYLPWAGPDVAVPLATALELDQDTNFDRVLEHLAGQKGHTLVLLDEADAFIRAARDRRYAILDRFRSLSEAGCCHFILAGFWDLYAAAVFEHRSPVKNFGETLWIGALEADACRDLASRPMATLGLRWESDDLIERVVSASGQRANLIAVACNEILKEIGPRDRVITASVVDAALDSFAIEDALEGWRNLGDDAESSRLDRIVVYATVERGGFTRRELDRIFKDCEYHPPDERLQRSLRRLELAYVLGREGESYTYTVPLFVERVRAEDPAERLANELSEVRGSKYRTTR